MEDLEQLSAFSRPGVLRAVIEISAGAADKREYDPGTRTFPVNLRNGKPRRIRFLPYPANYGFIPGKRMHKEQGGDGDAVDVRTRAPRPPSLRCATQRNDDRGGTHRDHRAARCW